jgi:hypothetical protein
MTKAQSTKPSSPFYDSTKAVMSLRGGSFLARPTRIIDLKFAFVVGLAVSRAAVFSIAMLKP